MAYYRIEFRFDEWEKNNVKSLIYDVAKKFRMKGITRKKAAPHVTLFGPFIASYEKKLVSELIYIAEKYTLIPFKIKGFNFFDNATKKNHLFGY